MSEENEFKIQWMHIYLKYLKTNTGPKEHRKHLFVQIGRTWRCTYIVIFEYKLH